mgnify:CR=1 FL=1
MWAIAPGSQRLIAIMTKNPESLRQLIAKKPLVKMRSANNGAMLCTAAANMVDRQKLQGGYTTASAFPAIVGNHGHPPPPPIVATYCSHLFAMSSHPFFVVSGAVCFPFQRQSRFAVLPLTLVALVQRFFNMAMSATTLARAKALAAHAGLIECAANDTWLEGFSRHWHDASISYLRGQNTMQRELIT